MATEFNITDIDALVAHCGTGRNAAIPILQAIQRQYHYLPEAALRRVCEITDIQPATLNSVATFFPQFRFRPAGRHMICVCDGTACHLKGSMDVHDAIAGELGLAPGEDTDAEGLFTLQTVRCLGCCTLAPAVQIDEITYGHLRKETVPGMLADFLAHTGDNPAGAGRAPAPAPGEDAEIRIGLGSCCVAGGSEKVRIALDDTLTTYGITVRVKSVSCVGMCHQTPLMEIVTGGGLSKVYAKVQAADVQAIVLAHFPPKSPLTRVRAKAARWLEKLYIDDAREVTTRRKIDPDNPNVAGFLSVQQRIATEHSGVLNPTDLPEYLRTGGFLALRRCLAGLGPLPPSPLFPEDSRKDACCKSNHGFTENIVLPRHPRESGDPAEALPISRHPRESGDPVTTAPNASTSCMDPRFRGDDVDGGIVATSNETARLAGEKPAGSSSLTPDQILDLIEQSGLRGRGGAGFPTHRKWRMVRQAPGAVKYLICNGDEGDPGAFMDRMILESFAYRAIESMLIASLAVGAHHGIFYIRAEYPLAVARMRAAIQRCEEAGLLGGQVMGAPHAFHAEVREGAGAFVCGEETAMIASLEGERPTPRFRPPFPAISGLHGAPTLVNNVETLSMVPWIIRHGAAAYAALGAGQSKGTKVFALAGKIRRGGLIEVPMGLTIGQIVQDVGGGVAEGRSLKAVQVGGPSGGCIPASMADLKVDYEALAGAGSMMGSGGLVVMDDTDCMVEMTRYFLSFTQLESCGKCTPCRVGTRQMLEILTRLCEGKGKPEDLDTLEQLAAAIKTQSLCGLGKTAPNPVITGLRHFRDEFEAHVAGHCPAHKCKPLLTFSITDTCIGCTKCAQVCPSDAIAMKPYELHVVDMDACIRCGACVTACPVDAVKVE